MSFDNQSIGIFYNTYTNKGEKIMKKVLSIVTVLVLSLSVLAGCSKAASTDAVTAASLTDNVDVFAKSIGKDG